MERWCDRSSKFWDHNLERLGESSLLKKGMTINCLQLSPDRRGIKTASSIQEEVCS
jgi:hypothetical protein